jgi:hypothetical protein
VVNFVVKHLCWNQWSCRLWLIRWWLWYNSLKVEPLKLILDGLWFWELASWVIVIDDLQSSISQSLLIDSWAVLDAILYRLQHFESRSVRVNRIQINGVFTSVKVRFLEIVGLPIVITPLVRLGFIRLVELTWCIADLLIDVGLSEHIFDIRQSF